MSSVYPFTIMTPTYNRAHTLQRAYDSLCEQNVQDFEWVIVDDGSTDHTAELVAQWQRQASFPIVYHWQTNQHKKTAFNQGVKLAKGELLVALDSDDTLVPNALEQLKKHWAAIDASERANYLGVVGLCARPNGQIVGDRFPTDPLDITSLELNFRYNVRGEKFGALRTDVLAKFPFPEDIPGFVPESLVWRSIARAGYKTRFVNTVFRVYYDSADSLSVQGKTSQQHALGLWLLAYDTVQFCWPWAKHDPKAWLMAAVRYTRFGKHLQATQIKAPAGYKLRGWRARGVVALMSPLGYVLYWRDCQRSRTSRTEHQA